MNELLDQLVLRLALAFFICAMLFLFKLTHRFIYPPSRHQVSRKFWPSQNDPDTIHLFSRILGIGIIISGLQFHLEYNLLKTLLDVLCQSMASFVFYLSMIYIIESIVLYNFEYYDEIIERRNIAYATICFSISVSSALVMNVILNESDGSLMNMFFMWLLATVIIGIGTKTYSLLSRLPFNILVIQKNMGVAFSYAGFFLALCLIISGAFSENNPNMIEYLLHVLLKILLASIIFPVFRIGIVRVFSIQDDLRHGQEKLESGKEMPNPSLGYGLYEGIIFIGGALLTSIILGRVDISKFYPPM